MYTRESLCIGILTYADYLFLITAIISESTVRTYNVRLIDYVVFVVHLI